MPVAASNEQKKKKKRAMVSKWYNEEYCRNSFFPPLSWLSNSDSRLRTVHDYLHILITQQNSFVSVLSQGPSTAFYIFIGIIIGLFLIQTISKSIISIKN